MIVRVMVDVDNQTSEEFSEYQHSVYKDMRL